MPQPRWIGTVASRSIVAALAVAAPLGGQIYVANANGDDVTVYDPAEGGNQAPIQQITAAPIAVELASDVAVDPAREEIVVVSRTFDQVYFFDLAADGAVAPLRTIAGATTTIATPWSVEVDVETGATYVLSKDASELLVFAAGAGGDPAPARVISTAPPWATATVGFDLDLVHDEIAVADRTDGSEAIRFLPPGADGTIAPIRSIGGAATGLTDPFGIAVDPLHDEIFATNGNSVRVFARSTSGDVAPLRVLAGAATGIAAPRGVAVDPIRDEIAVVRTVPDAAILFFPRTAAGDVAPIRTISGTATQLDGPSLHAWFPRLVFADGFEGGSTSAGSASSLASRELSPD